MATGILNTGVRTEADAALALLADYLENKSVPLKTSAIVGLGLAYAGSCREDLLALLLQFVADETVSMEIAALASLSLGFIFVSSGNGEVAGTILQTLMEREDKYLDEKWSRFMVLGLALLYLGNLPRRPCYKMIVLTLSSQNRSSGWLRRDHRDPQGHRTPNLKAGADSGRRLLVRGHGQRAEDPSDAPPL